MDYSAYRDALTLKNKFSRFAWNVFALFFFRPLAGPIFRRYRSIVLRLWGAKVGKRCAVDSSARIWAPWNLTLGDYVALGARAELYDVAPITIGSNVTISQDAYLCTASHDIAYLKKPLVSRPIAVGDSAWIAAKASVMPGVTIGEGAIVAASAVVTKDVASWNVVGGNPACFLKRRELKGE